ncbi:MAG: DUF1987 domain-containing protein [Flavobacteriales bacterium]|nr:DUF1987 domain-containing protein [Flavobacteriales bacterium]
MDKKLYIEATSVSPEIDFDIEALRFSIRGRSMPENTEKFYNPVTNWLNDNLRFQFVRANIDIALDYYNTGSFIRLMGLFNLLHELNDTGNEFRVRWICEAEDEDNVADGLSFKEVVKIPFEIIEL